MRCHSVLGDWLRSRDTNLGAHRPSHLETVEATEPNSRGLTGLGQSPETPQHQDILSTLIGQHDQEIPVAMPTFGADLTPSRRAEENK